MNLPNPDPATTHRRPGRRQTCHGLGIRKKARIAQSVEQLAFNQLVLGSSPSPRTFLNLLDLKSL